eukprot:11227387-Ditylum_brightwellii.AAC.1
MVAIWWLPEGKQKNEDELCKGLFYGEEDGDDARNQKKQMMNARRQQQQMKNQSSSDYFDEGNMDEFIDDDI